MSKQILPCKETVNVYIQSKITLNTSPLELPITTQKTVRCGTISPTGYPYLCSNCESNFNRNAWKPLAEAFRD